MTTGDQIQQTLTNPTTDTASALVEQGIADGALVTLFGRCRVDYDGRASSTLGPGERHVMIKSDGATLVHTDEGQQPVNWQPPGCDHSVDMADDTLVIASERTTPAESLEIIFQRIVHAGAFQVTDEPDLSLTGTEADLRDRILDDPSLIEPSFRPRSTERQTPAGAIDIYGEDAAGNRVVVELKRRRVGPDAVGQLDRYVEALDRDLHDEAAVRGILVAPSVTDAARTLLAQKGLEFVAVTPPSE